MALLVLYGLGDYVSLIKFVILLNNFYEKTKIYMWYLLIILFRIVGQIILRYRNKLIFT